MGGSLIMVDTIVPSGFFAVLGIIALVLTSRVARRRRTRVIPLALLTAAFFALSAYALFA